MKNTILILILEILAIVSLASCAKISHNGNLVGVGKVFKIGAGDYGITYVNGLVAIEGVRENSEMVVETNDGDSFANPASAVKGLRTIRFRTGPQITGYLVDLAGKNADAATAYVGQIPALNQAQWDSKQTRPSEAPNLSESRFGTRIPLSGAAAEDAAVELFTCSGDCELTDLWKNDSIAYQSAVATKLLTYADDTTTFDGETTTLKHSLEAFLARMEQLTANGKTTTQMRVKCATVKGGVLTYIRYIMIEPDGNQFETNCPECVLLEE